LHGKKSEQPIDALKTLSSRTITLRQRKGRTKKKKKEYKKKKNQYKTNTPHKPFHHTNNAPSQKQHKNQTKNQNATLSVLSLVSLFLTSSSLASSSSIVLWNLQILNAQSFRALESHFAHSFGFDAEQEI
jgi:hypothetical protein